MIYGTGRSNGSRPFQHCRPSPQLQTRSQEEAAWAHKVHRAQRVRSLSEPLLPESVADAEQRPDLGLLTLGEEVTHLDTNDAHSKSHDAVAHATYDVLSQITKEEGEKGDHERGRCNPCLYYASRRGCIWASCSFCHATHEVNSKRPRPPKSTREKWKETLDVIFKQPEAGSQFLFLHLGSRGNKTLKN